MDLSGYTTQFLLSVQVTQDFYFTSSHTTFSPLEISFTPWYSNQFLHRAISEMYILAIGISTNFQHLHKIYSFQCLIEVSNLGSMYLNNYFLIKLYSSSIVPYFNTIVSVNDDCVTSHSETQCLKTLVSLLISWAVLSYSFTSQIQIFSNYWGFRLILQSQFSSCLTKGALFF